MRDIYLTIRMLELFSTREYLTSKIVVEELDNVKRRTADRILEEFSLYDFIEEEQVGREKRRYLNKEKLQVCDSFLEREELSFLALIFEIGAGAFQHNEELIHRLKDKIFSMSTDPYTLISKSSKIDFHQVSKQKFYIEQAIKEKNVILFDYTRYGKAKKYIVNPYRLIYYNGYILLLGLHDNILKKFSLDYIENIEYKKDMDYIEMKAEKIDQILLKSKTMWFSDQEEMERIKIKLPMNYYKMMEKKEYFPDQEILDQDEDGFFLQFSTYNENDFWEMIKPWIPDFEVIQPKSYREFVYKKLNQGLLKNS